jgi:hypothetical protein
MEPTIGSGCDSRYSFTIRASFSRRVRPILAPTLAGGWAGGWVGGGGEDRTGCAGELSPASVLDPAIAAKAAKAKDGIDCWEFANRSIEGLRVSVLVEHAGS